MAVAAILDLQLKADSVDTALPVIHETLTATRAFPGCLGITVLVDSANPAHVAVYELWESAEADTAYRAWRDACCRDPSESSARLRRLER